MQSINRLIEKSQNSQLGFTIVELLMVIGIISVLITITVSAVTGSLQGAREQKAKAICTLVEQGIATYYAQYEKWPVQGLEDKKPNAGSDGSKNTENKTIYLLDDGEDKKDGEVQTMVKALVLEAQQNRPMMDISGLYVARKNGGKYGMDFFSAVRGTKKDTAGIRLQDMVFGYPCPGTGQFRMFRMSYSPTADKVTVSMQK